MTSGVWFHHSEIMFLASVRGREMGRRGWENKWVAADLGQVPRLKEKAAGTISGWRVPLGCHQWCCVTSGSVLIPPECLRQNVGIFNFGVTPSSA